jgi:hypothetical protein
MKLRKTLIKKQTMDVTRFSSPLNEGLKKLRRDKRTKIWSALLGYPSQEALRIEPFVATDEEIYIRNNKMSFVTAKHRTEEAKESVPYSTVIERLTGNFMVGATKIIHQTSWKGSTEGRVNLRIQRFLSRNNPGVTTKCFDL